MKSNLKNTKTAIVDVIYIRLINVTVKSESHCLSAPSMTMTYSPLFLGQDDVSTHSGKTVHESSSSSSSSDNQVPVINESVETALVGTSSMFASFINVTSTLIGAGIFSLPYAVSRTGYMLGIVLLFLGALFSYMGSVLMSHCVSKTSLPSSYAAVAKVSSLSYLSFIIDGAVLLKCVGVASSYPILIGGLMPAAMRQFHADHGVYDRHLWIFFSLIVCAPLCLLRRVDSLKWTSTLSISFSCFISLLFLSYATRLFNLNPCQISRHSVPCTESVEAFAWSVDALKVFPIFIFCFTCQHCTFGVVNELKSPTQARVNNVFFGAISTAIVLYLIVSISGYTTYGRNVLPNCLKSYPGNTLLFTTLSTDSIP